MTDDLIEVYDVTFTKVEGEYKVQAMHNDLYKAFDTGDGWIHPVLTFEAQTTQQAKAQYVMMLAAEEIKVVDDNYEP
jgi:hypothetical protein